MLTSMLLYTDILTDPSHYNIIIPGLSRYFYQTYLSRMEGGERNPSSKNLAAIARALNIRLADLLNIDAEIIPTSGRL